MILLLDLDDTCLVNSMDTFIPAFLEAFGDHLSELLNPEILIPTLVSATQIMVQNDRPDRTLKEVFDEAFFPALDADEDEIQVYIDSFYEEKYPHLKSLTQALPQAVEMVEEAFKRGYSVVIATNPLFPLSGINQRLEWAGLSPEEFQFSLIPSYESYHFAKPNPAFFAETLSRLGWPQEPVLMVGDDYDFDIASAQKMGLSTFRIDENKQGQQQTSDSPNGSGSISDLLPWLDSMASEDLYPNYASLEAMLAVLRSSPAVLTAFSEDLHSTHWIDHPQPDEWSFTEILCHLRDVDREVNIPRFKQVLSTSNPFLAGIDTDKWADERLYYCQNGKEALNDFTSARIHLLDMLEEISPQDFQRPANHAIFGPTNLKEMLEIIAGHDRLHIRQALQSLKEIELGSLSEASAQDRKS